MQLQAHACTHTRAAAKDADRQVSTDELSRVWSMRFSDGSLRVWRGGICGHFVWESASVQRHRGGPGAGVIAVDIWL